MKLALGFVGLKRSGKGTAVQALSELLGFNSPPAVKWQNTILDINREICRRLYMPEEPEFLEKLPLGLKLVFGLDVFANPRISLEMEQNTPLIIQNPTREKIIQAQNWQEQKLGCIRYSDILREISDMLLVSHKTKNLQRLSPQLQVIFGPNVLAEAVLKRALDYPADIISFDGLRWPQDKTVFRETFNGLNIPNFLIYIYADQKKRYEWAKNRGENTDEQNMTFHEFQAQEREQTELYIPILGEYADFKIVNDSDDKEAFKEKIKTLLLKKVFAKYPLL